MKFDMPSLRPPFKQEEMHMGEMMIATSKLASHSVAEGDKHVVVGKTEAGVLLCDLYYHKTRGYTMDHINKHFKKLPAEQIGIAEGLRKFSDSAKQLMQSGLTEKALVALLHDSTKFSKTDILKFLNALHNLERDYLLPKEKQQ